MFKRLSLVGILVFNLVMVTFAAAPQLVAAATTVIVSPANMQGWSSAAPLADTRTGGAVSLVPDANAPGGGTGALRMITTNDSAAKVQYMHDANNTPLSSVTELSYYTKQVSASFSGGTPSFQLPLYLNGTTGFSTLVFEPYQGAPATPVQPSVWQSWDVTVGKFFSTKTITCPNGTVTGGSGGPANYTLSDIKGLCPDAIVLAFGLNVGSGNPDYNVLADLFDFNGTIYDFEPLATCYVNASSPGSDANSGATAAAAKRTIQACIDITGSGGTVIVAAGTYAENLNVDRPLTIKGPNFGVSANGTARAAEAIITPASTTNTLITLRANNVAIDGFTIDGDNPAVSSPVASNQLGVNVDAVVGVSNATGVLTNATNVSNNIVKNLGDGVFLSMGNERSNNGTPSLNNVFVNNAFDNMSSRDPNGHAIALMDNTYATITGNVVTRSYMGVYVDNFYNPNTGTPAQISGNTIQSYGYGVFYNNQYSNAAAWAVTNNIITTATYSATTDAPGAATGIRNTGVILWSLRQPTAATIVNNSVTGANYGYRVWNVTGTAVPSISGGTLTNNNYGLRYYTCDVNFGQSGAGAATVTVKDVTISGAVVAGLQVLDDPTANAGNCLTTSPITLLAQNVKETGSTGTSIGALISGPKANFGATGSTFQGNSTGIQFANLAQAAASGLHFNVIVNNPTAGLDANTAVGAVDVTNNWWGCNTGPASGNLGCDKTLGALVNSNPWLTLRITRDPAVASTAPNSSFAIVADLVTNSNATDTSASGTVQNGTAITFAVTPAGAGTITPASGGTTAGKLDATFVAGASGCPVVSATSDDQTVSTSVCINAAPTVTPSVSPSASPSVSPSASPLPSPSTPASVAYTVNASVSGPGAITPSGTSTYGAGSQASYTAAATGNAVFVGWTLDGVYVGYASPLTFAVNSNRTLVATFVARTSFSDVSTSDPDYQAISFLAALGIINPNGVNGSGQFQPDVPVKRAEISAFIARLFGWEGEFHANNFPDRCLPNDPSNCIDARLWNDVAALKDYGVVGGYTDSNTCTAARTTAPCYLPRDSVKRVQVLSIIARSFIKTPDLRSTGFWDRLAANSAQYTNVGTEGTQRSDLTTYRTNAGPIPGQESDATFPNPEGDGSRRFVIEALYQAFAAQFSIDRVP